MSNKFNIESLAARLCEDSVLDEKIYSRFDVKRGLRNADGTGVLAGVTRVSNVHGYIINEYERVPCEGELQYRGINVNDIIAATDRYDRFGYDEASWLLLFGSLPTQAEIDFYDALMDEYCEPPNAFIEDMIMKAPSPDIMNKLARSVLALYSYDENPDDTSIDNVLRQSLMLISRMPMIMTAAYQVKRRHYDNESLFLHSPVPGQGMAENILSMLRADRKFTHDEARLLDKCLILHAEHGGGNNSTFTVRTLTSSGTDTFSAIAAGIGALKGPLHGGANIKVVKMLDDIKAHISDAKDDDEIKAYLQKILNREAGDRSGKIYGVGHAVYTLSDPRATILRKAAEEQCDAFGMREDFEILNAVERMAPELLQAKMHNGNAICANVDLYSGLVYRMLNIPEEMYTPLFAIARLSGWCAHRLEELISGKRIMRPAYRAIHGSIPYIDIKDRKDNF